MASTSYSLEDRFHPPAKLMNKTAASGFSYLNPQQQQQCLPAARSLSSGVSGYNSLPRQRGSTNSDVPKSLSHARRKLVNTALQDYLKSLNAMTRSIVLETETIEKENQCDWKKMDASRKEDLVNNHFMPADVRMQYEHERAESPCSLSSSWEGTIQGQQYPSSACGNGLVVENRTMQSNDWDKDHDSSHQDLIYANEWSSTASDREETQEITEQSHFNRLHKKQLSFRASHKHAVKPRQQSPPQQQQQQQQQQQYNSFRTQLGSDGESPRTSDEDFEGGRLRPQDGLGFQRTKLRSYSMRSRRGGPAGTLKNTANLRSSVRSSNRIRTNLLGDSSESNSFDQSSRPSHYHTYSNTSTDTDFDEAIDTPDESLMMDHISSRKSSIEETDIDDYELPRTPKYTSRARRSFRATPKITLENSEVHVNRSLLHDTPETSSLSTALSSSDDTFLSTSVSAEPDLYRSPSRESLDMDSISIAPSDTSKYPMDDEEETDRMTPDSVLSLSSYSSRPRTKTSEIAVLRNRRGKRGGSHIKVATSDFADRHTQFKNKHHPLDSCQTSAATTRANSPASSVSSTPTHHTHALQDGNGYLKTPDLPCSPDHLSLMFSPPSTPLAVSYPSHSQFFRKSLSSTNHEHRESGYVSSSSDSFPVAGRR